MARLGAPSVPKHTVAGKQMALGRSILHLKGQSMPCWSSGIMIKTEKMVISLTTQRCKAASSFGGAAMNVHKARCTAGRLLHTIERPARRQEDVLVVLGTSFVSATPWKLYVPMLLPTLTPKRMVSVLLNSPVQHTQSTAGCQISLEPKSVL